MYRYMRRYTGPLKACILDWSGTTADKYVIAPAVIFREVFEKHGVPITMKEARLPMGLRKDLHIYLQLYLTSREYMLLTDLYIDAYNDTL